MRHSNRNKAFTLKNEAHRLVSAMRLVNNTPFDIDPADERVVLRQAKLPGFQNTVFEGEARLNPDGSVASMGVRREQDRQVTEVIVQTDVGRTSLQERTYCQQQKTTFVVNALFSLDGQLLRYSETEL